MKKIRLLLILPLFGFTNLFLPTDTPHFTISMTHYFGAAGYSKNYIVTADSIKLITNCDFENCKPETLYKAKLTAEQSQDFYNFLITQRLDTLKEYYEVAGIDDGRQSEIKISGDSLPDKTIYLSNYLHPVTETIFKRTDKLITKKKYRLYKDG